MARAKRPLHTVVVFYRGEVVQIVRLDLEAGLAQVTDPLAATPARGRLVDHDFRPGLALQPHDEPADDHEQYGTGDNDQLVIHLLERCLDGSMRGDSE